MSHLALNAVPDVMGAMDEAALQLVHKRTEPRPCARSLFHPNGGGKGSGGRGRNHSTPCGLHEVEEHRKTGAWMG
jgi:hypothetical protein